MMTIKKFSLDSIAGKIRKPWDPKDVEAISDCIVRIARFEGEYHWHKHENEDELFLVISGRIKIRTRKEDVLLNANEGVKIPKGVEHCPVALEPSIVLMFEPAKLKSKGIRQARARSSGTRPRSQL